MRNEHPAAERDTVISRGRVQGGLQPTRAFGDAVYKWTREEATKWVGNSASLIAGSTKCSTGKDWKADNNARLISRRHT